MRFLPFVIIFSSILALFYRFLFVYFAQDDFFHIKASITDGSLREFASLFGFYPIEERGYGFYRPVFREVFFNIFYGLFGLNVLPYRLGQLVLHFINTSLVFVLIYKLFKDKKIAFLAAFFTGISAANVAVLYYLAGGIQALGATFFILLSLIFFKIFLATKLFKNLIFSLVACVFALGSHEVAAVLPVLLAGLTLANFGLSSIKSTIVYAVRFLWPYFLLLVLYLYLEFFQIGFSRSQEQYQMVFSPARTVNSYAWYVGWSLGLPEMLIDFVQPGLHLNPSLMRHWGDSFKVIFPSFFALIGIIAITLIYAILYKLKLFKNLNFWFLVFWFLVGLLPVVFLPMHKSTYYLTPVLPAFWGGIAYLIVRACWIGKKLNSKFSKVKIVLFILTSIVLTYFSVQLGDETYWAASRGRLAKRLINIVETEISKPPSSSGVYFTNDPKYPFVAKDWGGTSKQAAIILNNEDGLQLYYNDPTLRVFYEDLGGVPEDFPKAKLYTVVAKIN